MTSDKTDSNKGFRFFRFWGRNRKKLPEDTLFGKKYHSFKNLLDANNQALEIIADLENIIYQDKPFGIGHVRRQVEILLQQT